MLRTVTPPSSDPVSLDEAKAHLCVDFADHDALITSIIAAATLAAQNLVQRRFITQTLELVLQDWGCGRVKLPIAPVAADGVVSVKYVDWPAQTQQTLDPSAYVVKTDGPTVSLVPAYGTIWPLIFPFSPEPIVIRFTAGEAAAPENVKAAIKLIVGHLYANRENVVIGTRAQAIEVPQAAQSLLLAESWN